MELKDLVETLLSEEKPEVQTALRFIFFEGGTQDEAAEVAQIGKARVNEAVRRFRRKLRRRL